MGSWTEKGSGRKTARGTKAAIFEGTGDLSQQRVAR